MWRLVGIPSDRVRSFWPTIEPWCQNCEDRSGGRWSAASLLNSLVEGKRQLWLCVDPESAPRAMIITEVETHEAGAVTANMVACAGADMAEWQATAFDTLIAWARSVGANHFVTYARPGWSRILKDRMRETHRILEVEL